MAGSGSTGGMLAGHESGPPSRRGRFDASVAWGRDLTGTRRREQPICRIRPPAQPRHVRLRIVPTHARHRVAGRPPRQLRAPSWQWSSWRSSWFRISERNVSRVSVDELRACSPGVPGARARAAELTQVPLSDPRGGRGRPAAILPAGGTYRSRHLEIAALGASSRVDSVRAAARSHRPSVSSALGGAPLARPAPAGVDHAPRCRSRSHPDPVVGPRPRSPRSQLT